MDKPFDHYSVEIHASVGAGLAAQILCDHNKSFVGRIDFYREAGSLPFPICGRQTGPVIQAEIYLVLAMSIDLLEPVITLFEHGGPWELELWPSGPLTGASRQMAMAAC